MKHIPSAGLGNMLIKLVTMLSISCRHWNFSWDMISARYGLFNWTYTDL